MIFYFVNLFQVHANKTTIKQICARNHARDGRYFRVFVADRFIVEHASLKGVQMILYPGKFGRNRPVFSRQNEFPRWHLAFFRKSVGPGQIDLTHVLQVRIGHPRDMVQAKIKNPSTQRISLGRRVFYFTRWWRRRESISYKSTSTTSLPTH